MKHLFVLITFLVLIVLPAQEVSFESQNLRVNSFIDGTLLLPESEKPPLAIIIAGTGPIDRDGNQNFLVNNSLKKLAVGLTKKGIATFRYDKRIVKQIREGNVDENMMFDHFVTDAKSVINYFGNNTFFSGIYVIGHSQGSLVGMLASQNNDVEGFISIAGAGKPIDEVIIDQISSMAPQLEEPSRSAFNELKSGKTTTNYPPALESVLNLSTQPFIMNWMKYHPCNIITGLPIPCLIINGTKDLQVPVDEANRLAASNENAELLIIDNMNHVLFTIEGDNLENSKSYGESFREISSELITSISNFIQKD
jgi:pimeloyl-ACP methyl ester carboxylesterase